MQRSSHWRRTDLFVPPPAVLDILRDRLNTEIDNIPDVPGFFNETRIIAYSAPDGFTAAQRLIFYSKLGWRQDAAAALAALIRRPTI